MVDGQRFAIALPGPMDTPAGAGRGAERRRQARVEEVRIKGVMMGGAERQAVAPVVRALIGLSTDVRSLHEARMGDHTDRHLQPYFAST
jgi:hypothetical protein